MVHARNSAPGGVVILYDLFWGSVWCLACLWAFWMIASGSFDQLLTGRLCISFLVFSTSFRRAGVCPCRVICSGGFPVVSSQILGRCLWGLLHGFPCIL